MSTPTPRRFPGSSESEPSVELFSADPKMRLTNLKRNMARRRLNLLNPRYGDAAKRRYPADHPLMTTSEYIAEYNRLNPVSLKPLQYLHRGGLPTRNYGPEVTEETLS